ncbi:MAG: hypothetical protein HC945_02495 [Nitrosarchaeum sp.]|nr:hypothetical protein [Nitrosarchaeum sp.]
MIDEEEGVCPVQLSFDPDPQYKGDFTTANISASDGLFGFSGAVVSVCDFNGCDASTSNGCASPGTVTCENLAAGGREYVSCQVLTPSGAANAYGYYACIGQNSDLDVLDTFSGGHCDAGATYTVYPPENTPARYLHDDALGSVEDCDARDYSRCDLACTVQNRPGSSDNFFLCDDYRCEGTHGAGDAACQPWRLWAPENETCTLLRANDAAALAVGRGQCGYNVCTPAAGSYLYLCHANAAGEPRWVLSTSLSVSSEAGVLGVDAQCGDGFDNDCDGLVDCADDGCNCEPDDNELTCTSLGYQWTPWNGGDRMCCGDDRNASYHEDDPYQLAEGDASPLLVCGDGKDNDCDGELAGGGVDWDTQRWNVGVAWDSAGVHGDDGCPIALGTLLGPASLEPAVPFEVNCTVNAPGGFNSVSVWMDANKNGNVLAAEGDPECPGVWDGTIYRASCPGTTMHSVGESVKVQCEVDLAKSFAVVQNISVLLPLLGCYDVDNDGYEGFHAVGCPAGTDCDDTEVGVHPGAIEICGDTHDNDCAGGDLACPFPPVHRVDFGSGAGGPASAWETFAHAEVVEYPAGPGASGWIDAALSGIAADSASITSAGRLFGDNHDVGGSSGVWNADLAWRTLYEVHVYTGDNLSVTGPFRLFVEDAPMGDVQAARGVFIREEVRVPVRDDAVTVRLDRIGGANALVSAIDVQFVMCNYDNDTDAHGGASCGGNDCDDTNPYRFSGNSNPYCDCDPAVPDVQDEALSVPLCDGIDNDCDGEIDEGLGCEGFLGGYVLDQYGAKVSGALVEAVLGGSDKPEDTTDAYGRYDLILPTGRQYVRASSAGCTQEVAEVNIATGVQSWQNFTLLCGVCFADCTSTRLVGRCDELCQGYVDIATGEECHFYSEWVQSQCHDRLPGSQLLYNSTPAGDVYVECCEGGPSGPAPSTFFRPRFSVNGTMKHLVVTEIPTTCNGEVCKIKVFRWME